tara:strand:- start:114 stop:1316 length:1203 start_codon:yes stop_codon:yes gene_type:complete
MRIRFSQVYDSLFIDEFCGDVKDLQVSLVNWFDSNGRHWIPWKLKQNGQMPNRGETLSVYGIWIAEVMLQQTQLNVVLPYWKKWMQIFPSWMSLANANEQEVLLHWQGLGYYARARRLYESARIMRNVIEPINTLDTSTWSQNIENWMELPGIGRSTAGSIISSAFDLPTPLLDGNVKRIFARLLASKRPPIKDELRLWKLSEYLLDKNCPRKFNQALMDLGANICTPNNPNCVICPIQKHCIAYALYDPEDFPVKVLKKPVPKLIVGIGVVMNSSGEVLIAQRLDNQSMGGMWEFPGGKKEKDELIETTIKREINEEIGIAVDVEEKLVSFDHAYTHKKFHFVVHICQFVSGEPTPIQSQQLKWVMPKQLIDYPFPAANSYIISKLNDYLLLHKKINYE